MLYPVLHSGHRTIRLVIQDPKYAHEQHSELYTALAGKAGCSVEFRGHAKSYGAIDIASDEQRDAVIGVLEPLAERGILIWEWADPVLPE